MKERYLIALDLDGTLLTDDKKITAVTKNIIIQLINDGHIVVIATGRTHRTSILYYHELGLVSPIINSNGALVHHPRDKQWGIHHLPLGLQTAREIIDVGYSFNAQNMLAAVQDDVYLEKFDQHIADFYGHETGSSSFHVGDLKNNLNHDPTGMLLYPDVESLPQLTAQLNDLQTEIVDHRNWGEPFHVIEVMNKNMNKREGIKKVADYYGIPKQRIIAFGDGSNDLEMIEYAGVGVAMENAVEELKSLAKFSTTTNETNGVASFLTEYFNLKDPILFQTN